MGTRPDSTLTFSVHVEDLDLTGERAVAVSIVRATEVSRRRRALVSGGDAVLEQEAQFALEQRLLGARR